MNPLVIAVLLGTGLVALLPTRRLAERARSSWIVLIYYLAFWLLLLAVVAVPGLRRLVIPLTILLAIAPFVTLRPGIDRLLGRPPRDVPPPPRNVTPPDV